MRKLTTLALTALGACVAPMESGAEDDKGGFELPPVCDEFTFTISEMELIGDGTYFVPGWDTEHGRADEALDDDGVPEYYMRVYRTESYSREGDESDQLLGETAAVEATTLAEPPVLGRNDVPRELPFQSKFNETFSGRASRLPSSLFGNLRFELWEHDDWNWDESIQGVVFNFSRHHDPEEAFDSDDAVPLYFEPQGLDIDVTSQTSFDFVGGAFRLRFRIESECVTPR